MKFKDYPEISRVTNTLDNVRRSVGGIVPPNFKLGEASIDKSVNSWRDIQSLFHPTGVLADEKGNPYFLYIRDHSISTAAARLPENRNLRRKLHFMVCQTLRNKAAKEEVEARFRKTNRLDGRYYVEFANSKSDMLPLDPCEHCLAELRYEDFQDYDSSPYDWGEWSKWRDSIKENFDVKKAHELSKNKLQEWAKEKTGIKADAAPSGYPPNWKKISYDYKRKRNWTCEECKVDLNKYRGLAEAHHIKPDKRDCRPENLKCLCIECHCKEHPHKVRITKPEMLELVRDLRARQSREQTAPSRAQVAEK